MNRRTKRAAEKHSKRRLFLAIASAALLAAVAGSGSGTVRLGAQIGCTPPTGNPIVCENLLTGNPSSEWDVSGSGDSTIQGFATDISVNRGQTISFKISTPSTNYLLDVYRMGYYSGLGARKVATVTPSASLPQVQPACLTDAATGLVDCGNWNVSASWAVPASATSGIYFAKARRIDTGGASHIFFMVRDDASTADLLFQTSDTTWQAYNQYGGNSLYVGAPGTNPGRAYKVSYNRPFTTRGTAPEDWVFNAEYPMVRFLESNGFNVAYMSGIDTDRLGPAILRQHRVFMSVGHDEYWSGAQRANVEAARATGLNLAFFSGNEVFWKTRWENSISTSATPYRTLVSYKETHAGAKIDPNPAWTGTWRDPRFTPPSDGGRPENSLTGTIFMVNSGTTGIQVPSAEGKMRFWRNTTVANLAPGAVATLPNGTLGYEWDEDQDNGFRPAGLVRLSNTTVSGVDYLQDFGSTYATGTANHALTLYRHSSGALVFGAGTVQWSWGLDSTHDRGSLPPSVPMKQATVNLFADMGVQPLTIQAGLTTAVASADTLAPTSTIISPANGGSVPANTTVTIVGTATENGGGQIGAVQVSVDGGTTWHSAVGQGNWSYTWQTGPARTVTLRSRAVDDSANIEVATAGSTITVGGGTATCPCSIWSNAQAPTDVTEQDPSAVELGTKFRADVSGFVTAIKFYKGPQNIGPHVGHLWTAGGSNLATVTFTGETASGWQQATLSAPVAITANTTYVVSYHTASGFYTGEDNYFAASGVDNGPLHAPQDGDFGPNGVYKYGSSGFPTETYLSESYWVDVVFATSTAPDTTPPVVSTVSPANGATAVAATSSVTATFNEPMNAATVNTGTFELRDGSNTIVPATVSLAGATATLQPSSALSYSTTYTARVKGGPSGVKDAANNALAVDFVWSFSTGVAPPPPPTTGPGGPILVISSPTNPFTSYYAELLRNEGYNAFHVTALSLITPALLANYDVVVLGEMSLTVGQVSTLSNWVTGGGNLIAMRPDKKLASLLGLTDAAATLPDAYMAVNTSAAPGLGIVAQSMQFHGTADRYTVSGASVIASLYSNATTATTNPAVTVRSVGSAGGQAAAFTYDLARSVVYTRQGNPAWSGDERDGFPPVRSDDLFFGGAQPNYVDLTKVAIPQADEQQRLFANLISFMNADRKPLPKFWYFPRGLKAVVVMTGDDHANNGTAGRFDIFNAASPQGCNVANWECVRGTSYIFPNTPITPAQVTNYVAQGFEVGAHLWMSGLDAGSDSPQMTCNDFSPASISADYGLQLARFGSLFPSALPVRTNRTHCIVWSDYDTQPQTALAHGIRLDTNYYYWPPNWVNDVPGLFTGSGMPMRFAKADGTMIDVYQATTQMTDESEQTYPFTSDTLLDRALGPEGFYGAFVTNMHTDVPVLAQSDAIVASAQLRGVPIISAKQLLDWLDGRNASTYSNTTWDGTTLSFSVATAAGANGLQAMLPAAFGGKPLTGLTRNGATVNFTVQTTKGVSYAVFNSTTGAYLASYALDTTAPVISGVTAGAAANSALVTWATNEAATSRVDFGTTPTALSTAASVAGQTAAHAVTLHNLLPSTTYYYRVTSADLSGNASTSPASPAPPATFTTSASPYTCPCTLWPTSQTPGQTTVADGNAVELGLKWRSATDGFVTGIRFYKGPSNTGVHTGSLWTGSGTLLGTATFTGETASGWQEALLPVPVPVTANTTYVASYHTDIGMYSADVGFFQTGVTSGPLQALASGVDGPNGVYKYGASGFPTDSFNATNYWVDITFTTSIVIDTTAPTVVSVSPVNGGTDAPVGGAVAVTFSEGVNASTVTAGTFELRDPVNALVPATVSYNGASRTATLQPLAPLANITVYTARVVGGSSGVRDPWGNALASDFTWSFTTLPLSVSDTTASDFGAGVPGTGTYVTQTADGEVILTPVVLQEFAGPTLPAGWSMTPWQAGGTAPVVAGSVVVDASRVSLDGLTSSGVSLQFKAVIGALSEDPFQHAGFGVSFEDAPWAMFSTAGGGGLFARTNDGVTVTDTPLPGSWLGTAHVYRIDWGVSSIAYYIDGTLMATHPLSISAQMRPIVSDAGLNGGAVFLDWLRMSPYATAGVFTSRVLTIGGGTVMWNRAAWTAAVPASTTLTMSARFGNTPVPDGTWTSFAAIPSSGSALSQMAVYVQYQATFAGTGAETPVLQDVSFSGVTPPPPTMSVNDVSLAEGNSGSTNATFTVSLAYPVSSTVSVQYATANGTATSGSDYTTTTGTLTIPSGAPSGTISVPVNGDITVEANETFTLNLSAPVHATIADGQGVATVVNDDQYRLSVNDATVTEGNSSSVTATFTVSLSQSPTQNITVNYATADGTATGCPSACTGRDYVTASNLVTFNAGTTTLTRTVSVTVVGDTLDEDNETFFVNLTNPVNAIVVDGQGVGTITDNDTSPSLSINNATVTEGNSGTANAVFTVSLSTASGRQVSVNYATTNGSASAPADYTSTTGTATIPAGSTSVTVSVPVVGDTLDEPNETFSVNLSGAVNASISDSQGNGTITDNDPPTTTISIANASVTEGNSGTRNITFTVTLSAASGQTVTVNWATASNTATGGFFGSADYITANGTVSFSPGATTQTLNVSVRGDTTREANETFFVNLSGAVNAASITDAQAIGTILNDEP